MKKIKWELNGDGVISKMKRRNFICRLFHKKYDQWVTVEQYCPKKEYTEKEIHKLNKYLYYERDLDDKDIVVLINSVRPGTFKESLSEITNSKYYTNVTAKEDIHLLNSSK